MNALEVRPMGRVEKALAILQKAGLPLLPTNTADRPLARLMNDLTPLGESSVVAIVRTLGQADTFNSLVRDQTADIGVGGGYAVISEGFASIREDAKRMISEAESGERSVFQRLNHAWMKIARGTIPARFEDIRKNANELFTASEDQIRRQQAVLEGYAEFRLALKEAGMLAVQLQMKAEGNYETARLASVAAQAALETTDPLDADANVARQMVSQLEIVRDERLTDLRYAESRLQTATDLAQNLSVSYNTGEVVMSRLAQTSKAHEQVWRKAVTFLETNESVLTALSATLTSIQGLNETTRGYNALKQGANDALDDLATVGHTVQVEALKAGYGGTLDVAKVKKLVDSIVSYETESRTLIQNLRQEAADNTKAIAAVVDEGKQRLTALANQDATRTFLPGSATTSVTTATSTPASV